MNARLVLSALWVASLVVVGYWQRNDGRTAERDEWQKREIKVQGEISDALSTAIKRTRELAKEDSVKAAKAEASRQQAREHAREAQHQLAMELAKDEGAKSCRVSDGTLRSLQRSAGEANTGARAGTSAPGGMPH